MKARLFARWMVSLRRAMPTTPQAHLFGMALRARDWHGARSDAIHRAGAQQEQEYAETATALAQPNRDRRASILWIRFIAKRWAALDFGEARCHR